VKEQALCLKKIGTQLGKVRSRFARLLKIQILLIVVCELNSQH